MLSFLGFIFFFVLIIIIFGLTIISRILNVLFGFGKRNTSSPDQSTKSTHKNNNGNVQDTPKRKKIFDDNEGEYVDFEELDS